MHDKKREQKINYWQPIIKEWKQGKLSAAAYCKQHQLIYSRFLYWQSLFASAIKRTTKRKNEKINFAQMVHLPTTSAPAQTHLELITPKGYTIKFNSGIDEQTLSRLLQVLKEQS